MKKSTGKNSITRIVKQVLMKGSDMTYEQADKLVRKSFPKSKFDKRHWSWYKAAYKRGALKGVR